MSRRRAHTRILRLTTPALQRAIDVVTASDYQASYRQIKQTLVRMMMMPRPMVTAGFSLCGEQCAHTQVNEFGYSKFEGTKDFIVRLLPCSRPAVL